VISGFRNIYPERGRIAARKGAESISQPDNTVHEELEKQMMARFEEALELGYGSDPHRAVELLELLLQEVQENEDRGHIILYEAFFLARDERTVEARAKLQEVANLWKRTPEHKARMAVMDALLDEADGQASRTLKKLNRILKQYPTLWKSDDVHDLYEELQFNRGRLLATIDDWRLALPVLEECLSFQRPKHPELYANLGICYFEAEKWEKAVENLKLALSKGLSTKYSSAAHYYLGRLSYLRGALPKAVKEFELALDDATSAGTSRKVIYDALAKSYQHLGLNEESAKYARLAKNSA
jgi:tetratricopeptide (TPR) repeat protein